MNASLVNSSMPCRTFQNLQDMGNHLILEYYHSDIDLNNYKNLEKKLKEIFLEIGLNIQNEISQINDTRDLSMVYLFSQGGHFTLHFWYESKSCAIDLFSQKSFEIIKNAETLLNDYFGWENCASFLMLERGKLSKYLANDYEDKSQILKNVKFFHREMSPYQEIRVYDYPPLGRILVLDGIVQIATERFQNDSYTLDMTKYNLQKDKSYEHVLIIGGGDFVIATHILENYPLVKKVTICEIDERVIEVVKKLFVHTQSVEKFIVNGRLEVVVKNGADYLKFLKSENFFEKISSIIIDCTDFEIDKDSIASELFCPNFYKDIYDLLEKDGIFSQQINHIAYEDAFVERIKYAGFCNYKIFLTDVPEYGDESPTAIVKK